MKKEKTAIQMLIEKMRKMRDDIPTNTQVQRVVRGRVVDCIMQAKYLLEKEQEQVEKAYVDGKASNFRISGINSEKYYKSKYGGEDVETR